MQRKLSEHNASGVSPAPSSSADFGGTWKERLESARVRAAQLSPPLDEEALAALRLTLASLDVSSPQDMALFWSGKDVPTAIPLNEDDPSGPKWWDKYAPLEVGRLRALGLGTSVEDTEAGRHLLALQLHYPEGDPSEAAVRELWDALSARFARAARGRIEIIAEGAFGEGVFRTVELPELLANPNITCINGLARGLFPADTGEAYLTLRRWNVERALRYAVHVESLEKISAEHRAAARDDAREAELWFAQDFFELLGPERELPRLSTEIAGAVDETFAARAWKYAARWRHD